MSSTSGPASCSATAVIPDHPDIQVAFSNATISNTTTVGDSLASSFAYHVYAQVLEGSSSATVSGTNTVQLTSAGPVRPGFLSISENYYSISGLSVGTNVTLKIGDYSQTCFQTTFGSIPVSCDVGPQNPSQTVTIPFTLGQAFTFTQTMSSSAAVGNGTIPHYADAQLTVRISLSEAESGSAVPLILADAPEPKSFALLACGLLGLTIVVKRSRRTN